MSEINVTKVMRHFADGMEIDALVVAAVKEATKRGSEHRTLANLPTLHHA
jgi:hypothetical protein